MYNDDPLRQPGPHTRSYTPKRWQKPHTRTHTLESDKGHTHTLLHSKTGGAGWISLRGWAPSGAHAVGSLAASERCLRPTTPSGKYRLFYVPGYRGGPGSAFDIGGIGGRSAAETSSSGG